MSDPTPFLPVTAEGWSTLVSNVITIGTFVVGLPFAIRWAHRLRREASAIRRSLRSAAGDVFYEHAALQHIQLISQPDPKNDAVWNIQWSRLRNAPSDELQTGTAKITSKHLLDVLKNDPIRIKASRSATVVGTVKFFDHGAAGVSEIVVPRVHFIDGDGKLRAAWLSVRRGLAWLLGEVV